MATATPAQQSAIVNLYVALFNRAPDAAGFEFWTQALANGAPLSVVTGAFFVSPETTAIYPAAQNAQAFVSAFYQTVFGRAPDAEGLVFWTNVLNAAGGPNSQSAKALLVSKIVDIVSTPLAEKPAGLTDAQYAETVRDRELFSKKNVAALDFAINVKSNDLDAAKEVLVDAVTPTTPTVPTTPTTPTEPTPVNETITLTAGADEKTTGAGNDTFNGFRVYDPQSERNVESLNNGDILDGGAGTGDKLNAELFMCQTVTPTLRNIEIVSLTVSGYGVLDLSTSTGVQQVGFAGGSGEGAFTHVGDAALFVSNLSSRVSFQGLLAENQSLTLTDVGEAGRPLGIDLNSSGEIGAGATATAYNIVASNALAEFYSAQAGAQVLNVTVSATGTNALTLSARDAATVRTITVTGTGSVDFSGQAFSSELTKFSGSSGNDSISFDSAPLSGAVINGGGGRDTLGITVQGYADLQTYLKEDLDSISNFEVLQINDALDDVTIDVSTLTAGQGFIAAGGLSGSAGATVTGLGANATVELRSAALPPGPDFGGPTLTLELADPSSNSDVLNVVLNSSFDQNGQGQTYTSLNAFGINQVETLNVLSTATANYAQAPSNPDQVKNVMFLGNSPSLKTITVTGDQSFDFTDSWPTADLQSIDASALKASAFLNGANALSGLTIKGSSTAANTLNGSDHIDEIVGGANADSIDGGAGADLLTGGKGNDTFTYARVPASPDANIDTITDFNANSFGNGVFGTEGSGAGSAKYRNGDVLRFSVSTDPTTFKVNVQADDGDDFIVDAANDGSSSAVLNSLTSRLFFDSNADGDVDYVIELSGVTSITAAAFELVQISD